MGRGAAVLGTQIVSLAVRWELYERTGNPWMLGLVGLAEVLPVVRSSFRPEWRRTGFPAAT
jgi:hypothetical protein